MHILASSIEPERGWTYAVVVNPIAGGLGGQTAYRYRLILAMTKDWIEKANTLLSLTRTPGVQIYETFNVLHSWNDLPSTQRRINKLIREAQTLSGHLYRQQLLHRKSP